MYEKIYKYLNELKLDAYIVYDFRGSNFVARQVMKFNAHTSRKWVAIFRKEGSVQFLVPKIEKSIFDAEGEKEYFASYDEFNDALAKHTKGLKKVAVDFSDNNEIPVQDIASFGFVSLLKQLNPELELVSSANLTQYISALWGESGYQSHIEATKGLTEIKDLAFEFVSKNIKDGQDFSDFDAMNFILDEYEKRGLFADDGLCIASTNERTGNPHYWPTAERNFKIEKNSFFLIDIWAKQKMEGSIYSDSTFSAWIGPDKVPEKVQKVWDIVREARDLGIEKVLNEYKNGLKGFQVDRVVRDHIIKNGFGDFFIHRTGHSIDINDHGSGADMDDYEKHDTRDLIADTGFSIEPGIYLPEFGVRNEINIYVDPKSGPKVTTFKQDNLVLI